MKFYNKQHKYYCGIDLHARKMYVCIINQQGKIKIHKNIKTDPAAFIDLIANFMDDISRRCGELVAHIQNTNTQYNLPPFKKKLSRKYNHEGVAGRFSDPEVRKSVEVDLASMKFMRSDDFQGFRIFRPTPGLSGRSRNGRSFQ